MSNNNTLCIAEWQTFGVKDICASLRNKEVDCHESANADSRNDDKLRDKAQKIFDELKAFANQKGNFDDREGNHIFLTPYRNNQLRARNYVGLIQTKSGFCIEILPKTFRTSKDSEGFKIRNCTCTHPLTPSAREGEFLSNDNQKSKKCPVCEAKNILLNMLKTLQDSPYKKSHVSNLKTHKFPLLEIFAIMFLDELECLIKRGIKSDYVLREENRAFLKGKLLFTQNLKQNLAHKERFFTASDEFIADIAPNRLIVSAILFLSRQNFSAKTSGRILQSRFVFEGISPSKNIDKDFAKCANLRYFKAYELLLLWCRVFLKRHNFMPYQGVDKAFALLFDMNVLFESFVAYHLKKYVANKKCEYEIKAQDKSKHLLKYDGQGQEFNQFQIIPDLVCRNIKDNNQTLFIADTKWKILDFNKNDYGIAQSDLYQMFAYLTKYQCNKGCIIYPKIVGSESIKHKRFAYKANICFFDKDTDKGAKENPQAHKQQDITLQICFFDCQKPLNQVLFFENISRNPKQYQS